VSSIASLAPDGEPADLPEIATGGGQPGPALVSGFGSSGSGPWRTAWIELRRNVWAMTSVVVLAIVVVACLAAPLYANFVAQTDPFASNLEGTTVVDGKSVPVMQQSTEGLGLGVVPIGPTWSRHFALGADQQGRDLASRLLYGGRNTLLVGAISALLICVFAAVVGLIAGYYGGLVDVGVSRLLDVLWAFPVYLFAICLSVVVLTRGISVGPLTIGADSLLLPILIITVIYIAYVARPIRGQVLSLRRREFVQAAEGIGCSDWRIITRDLLPNILTTIIVFIPLMAAIAMLTESALSFLSIGVQPPNASWGTIINDGQDLIYTRPMVDIAPGILIAVTVLALNVLGDGVRDALDPNAKLRGSV
jgi:peptide/nickel transport system permease protein